MKVSELKARLSVMNDRNEVEFSATEESVLITEKTWFVTEDVTGGKVTKMEIAFPRNDVKAV